MKKVSILIALFLVGGIAAYTGFSRRAADVVYNSPLEAASSSSSLSSSRGAASSAGSNISSYASSDSSAAQAASLPGSVSISVPFASQAPLGNWALPYQEACEEASLLLVHHYLSGEPLTPEIMDRSIVDLVAFEERMALPADITIAQLAAVAQSKYGYRTTIIESPTLNNIQEQLASGNAVIVPLAGRDLGNPYYSGEGPWYHMLVIIGYDGKHFITNDVGTKRGAGYKYRYETLMNAIHDWTGVKEEIRRGKPSALVVTR